MRTILVFLRLTVLAQLGGVAFITRLAKLTLGAGLCFSIRCEAPSAPELGCKAEALMMVLHIVQAL